jgi:hypothetical protein
MRFLRGGRRAVLDVRAIFGGEEAFDVRVLVRELDELDLVGDDGSYIDSLNQ